MRIALFTRCLPDHGLGGMEVHAGQVAEGLAARGHDVVVYTTRLEDGPATRADVPRLRVEFLERTRPRSYRGGYWKASRNAFLADHARAPFDAFYSESGGAFGVLGMRPLPAPAVVFLVGTAGMELLSKLQKAPTPRTVGGIGWNLMNLLQSRRLLPRASRILCESEGLRTWVLREHRLDPARVSTRPLGADTDRFTPLGNVLPELLELPPARIVMGGRLEHEKGFDVALRALHLAVPGRIDVATVLIGEGSQKTNLLALAHKLAVRVRWLPPLLHERLPELYRGATIYLMPTRRHEGSALSIVEAMACGCAVISSRTGGLATLFEEGVNGLMVPPDQPEALGLAIQELLQDPVRRQSLGHAARESAVRRFSLTAMLDGVEDALRAAVAEGVRR